MMSLGLKIFTSDGRRQGRGGSTIGQRWFLFFLSFLFFGKILIFVFDSGFAGTYNIIKITK